MLAYGANMTGDNGLEDLPTVARSKVSGILAHLPATWRVVRIDERAATGGRSWDVHLVDEHGQAAGALAIYCSDRELGGER